MRAIEPIDGINLMKRIRKSDKLTDLARGPGRLAAALEIDKRLDGVAYVPMVRFGLGLRFGRLRTFAQLCASASRVRWAGYCVSSRRTVLSLAAQRDKKSLYLLSLDSNWQWFADGSDARNSAAVRH